MDAAEGMDAVKLRRVRLGKIHAGKPETSRRLGVVLASLRRAGAKGLTTRELATLANDCATHSSVAELRAAGLDISCVCEGVKNGRRVYRYKLVGERATRSAA